MPYHRRYHQDALQGYRKLTLEERGAYTTILDLIYDEGGPIDFNERWLAGELNCSVRKARVVIDALIDARKLYLTSAGKISNHRAETELENALKISRKCAENVSKREEKKRETARISSKINKTAHPSINGGSSIPYTSTNNRLDRLEYDAGRETKIARDDPPPPDDPVAAKDAAEPKGTTASPLPPMPVAGMAAAGACETPHEFAAPAVFGGDHLIAALEGRGGGRGRMFELAAAARRRH